MTLHRKKFVEHSAQKISSRYRRAHYVRFTKLGFGSINFRFAIQFPVLHILLRHSYVLEARIDLVSKDITPPLPRHLILIACVVRWHFEHACPEQIPWLVSLYQWVAQKKNASPVPFHKMLLSPAYVVLKNGHCRPTLREVERIVELTWAILDVYFPERSFVSSYLRGPALGTTTSNDADDSFTTTATANRNAVIAEILRADAEGPRSSDNESFASGRRSSTATAAPASGDAATATYESAACGAAAAAANPYVSILPDGDPRLIFGILYLASKLYPSASMGERIMVQLEGAWGELGMREFISAGKRIEYLQLIEKKKEHDTQRYHRARNATAPK